jgi:hypothetical protein
MRYKIHGKSVMSHFDACIGILGKEREIIFLAFMFLAETQTRNLLTEDNIS